MAKILIVEDDAQISTYIGKLLETDGHVALVADSAERGADVLSAEPDIALLVLDQNLGKDGVSGLNLLTAIRGHPHYRDLPVIVCTGETELAVVRGFLTHRIAGFITKPFQPHRFIAEIHRVLEESGSGKHAPRLIRCDDQ